MEIFTNEQCRCRFNINIHKTKNRIVRIPLLKGKVKFFMINVRSDMYFKYRIYLDNPLDSFSIRLNYFYINIDKGIKIVFSFYLERYDIDNSLVNRSRSL